MSKKRTRVFSIIKDHKKKFALLTMLCICAGVYTAVAGILPAQDALRTTGDEIPVHDGDVLVDSLNVTEEEEDNSNSKLSESELVTSDDVAELENTDTYFQELRATLDMDRNKVISMLTETEASAATSEEKEAATKEKMQILKYMDQEQTVEALIANKGLPDTFVVLTDNGVTATVNSKELDQEMVTKICDIIMRETGRSATEIVVQDAAHK